jgi:hypothetical protein
MKKLFLAIGLVLATACDREITGVGTARVTATKEANGIRLTNLSDKATGYFLIDPQTLALVDWAPCVSESPECLRLPAKGNVLVPFDQIMVGGPNSEEVAIYTWWVVPDIEGVLHADVDDPFVLKLSS